MSMQRGLRFALVFLAILPNFARAADSAKSVQIERYDIWVALRPDAGSLRATATLTLRASAPVSSVTLMLNRQLKISRIEQATHTELAFVRDADENSPRVNVTLHAPTAGEITLRVSYSGIAPADSLDYVSAAGILLRDESGWYPTIDPTAFAQHRIRIIVPAGWTAAAGGTRTSTELRERTVYDFTTTRPVYSRAIAATPEKLQATFVQTGAAPTSGTEPAIRVCLPDPFSEPARKAAAQAASALSQFAKMLGPPPFSEFTILPGFPGVHTEVGYSGPGFLVMNEDDLKHFGREGYSPYFLPHEIAHQWFPQQVAHATEEDGWLAESLGQYLALRYLEARNPAEARRLVQMAMRDALASDPLQPISLGLKLFALGNDVTQQTLYARGMLVWRTLEAVIGQENVDRSLRVYLSRFAGRSARIADFRAVAEEISGRELHWFFSYYIGGTEVPQIIVRRTPSLSADEVTGEVLVYGAPASFSARVELRVETSKGLITQNVTTRGPATPYTIIVPAPVINVEVDPDERVLRWTEPARLNLAEQTLIAAARRAVYQVDLDGAEADCTRALQLDPEDLSGHEQETRFELGLLYFHRGQLDAAYDQLGDVLQLASFDMRTSDAYYAWAHVYRARIAFRRHEPALGRAEVEAGLSVDPLALEAPVTQTSRFSGTTTAEKELHKFLASPASAGQLR